MIDEEYFEDKPVKHIINEVQLVLSEKRTALSVLRTGIAIVMFPLSVLTVLLATSRYFNIFEALVYAIPLTLLCLILLVYGVYLIIRSSYQIKRLDRTAKSLLRHSEYLSKLLDLE